MDTVCEQVNGAYLTNLKIEDNNTLNHFVLPRTHKTMHDQTFN